MNSNKIFSSKIKRDNREIDTHVKIKSPLINNKPKLPSLNETKSKLVTTPKKESEIIVNKNDNVMTDVLNLKIIDLEKQLSALRQVSFINIESW